MAASIFASELCSASRAGAFGVQAKSIKHMSMEHQSNVSSSTESYPTQNSQEPFSGIKSNQSRAQEGLSTQNILIPQLQNPQTLVSEIQWTYTTLAQAHEKHQHIVLTVTQLKSSTGALHRSSFHAEFNDLAD